MIEKKYVVTAEEGLHARPASVFAKESAKFKSDITMFKGDDRAKAYQPKSILSIMTSAVGSGDEITIVAEGADEADVIAKYDELFANGFA